MEVPQRFCVRWNSYKSNLQTAFPKLLTSEHFVDVTLACEKQFIKCHKIVLSACSVYFESLLVNNPCQHPIIFMKDVEFWEIKALVEFMYKGEVNVSQNQLDSLLKSAESLQIRGLSGTKEFVNFEQSDDCSNECKGKRCKSDNEDDDDSCKRKKKKNDEDEKCVQITSIKGSDDHFRDKKEVRSENEGHKVVKEETVEEVEYNYETNFMDLKEEEEEEDIERFNQEVFYPDHRNDPGPSGIAGIRQFGENLVITEMVSVRSEISENPKKSVHTLKTMYDSGQRKIRRMCVGCYAQIKETEGREAARKKGKKVSTYCSDCKLQPFYCLECFGQHNKSV